MLDFASMPRHHILQDLKACVPILFYEQDFSVKAICKIIGIWKSLIYASLAYFRAYGVAHNPHAQHKTSRQQLLNSTDIKFISSLIDLRHMIYLDEIQDELYQH